MKTNRHLLSGLGLFLSAVFGMTTTRAADGTWTLNGSGNWNAIGNWNSGAGPIADGDGYTADFSMIDITATRAVTADARTIGNLTFGDTTPNNVGWTLQTGTITIGNGGSPGVITVGDLGTASASITAPLAGAGITKEGSGMVVLGSASSSFAGDITVNAGTLSFGADTHLGNAANDFFVNNNAVLRCTGNFTLGAGRVITLGAGGGTLEATASSLTINTADRLAGSTTLTKTGAGTVILGAENNGSFSGSTVVNAGTLQIYHTDALGAAAPTVTINNGGTLNLSGAQAAANMSNVTVNNGGTLKLAVAASITGTFPAAAMRGKLHVETAGIGAAATTPVFGDGGNLHQFNNTGWTQTDKAIHLNETTGSGTAAFTLSAAGRVGMRLTEPLLQQPGSRSFKVYANAGTIGGGGYVRLNNATDSTYDGGTQVNDGNLVAGSTARVFGTGNVTATGGAVTLLATSNVGAGAKVKAVSPAGIGFGANVDLTGVIDDTSDGRVYINFTTSATYDRPLDFTQEPLKGMTLGGTTLGRNAAEVFNTFAGPFTIDDTYPDFAFTTEPNGSGVPLASFVFSPSSGALTDKSDLTPRSLTVTAGGVTDTQGSTVTLAASNSYSGGTTVTCPSSWGGLRLLTSGAAGTGTITLNGGLVVFAGNHQSHSNGLALGANAAVWADAVVGSLSGNLNYGATRMLTCYCDVAGSGLTALTGTSAASGTGHAVLGKYDEVEGALAATDMNLVAPGGSLSLDRGALILVDRDWVHFIGNRTGGFVTTKTGANTWTMNDGARALRGAGGFARRDTVGAADPLVISGGTGVDASTFNRHFQLGSPAKDAAGAWYANSPVHLAQNTTATKTDGVGVRLAMQGPGYGGNSGSGVIHRIAADVDGTSVLYFGSVGTASATNCGEVVLAGANTWSGTNADGVIVGQGGASVIGDTYVRFDANANLPRSGLGSTGAYLLAHRAPGNTPAVHWLGGYLLTAKAGGETYTLPSGYKIVLGVTQNLSGRRDSVFGSASDDGQPGASATFQGGSIVLLVQLADEARFPGLLVRDGTLTLGAGGAPVTFEAANTAGA